MAFALRTKFLTKGLPMTRSVLIVDDDADIRDFLRVALKADGWDAQVTDSFYGALGALDADNSISCMLLDYNLPGMPIEDFLKQARSACPPLTIILMTAADRVADKAKKLGLKKYLAKPFNFTVVRNVLQECAA